MKLRIYAREQVAHAWPIDPLARTLEVMRLENERWSIVAAHGGNEVVAAEPFEALPLTCPCCGLMQNGGNFALCILLLVFVNWRAAAQKIPLSRAPRDSSVTAASCLGDAIFRPWHRSDSTFSFRWDPEEDVRYALMAGDPTTAGYKQGTQHGANRLAAVGVSALTIAPELRRGRVRPALAGGAYDRGGFSFAWPIWREPATLAAIRALVGHPDLRTSGGLAHLGVEYVLVARRFSVGKFMNFSRARLLEGEARAVPASTAYRA